ncbi:MAG: hypothetical protein KDD53_03505 [Bdellovibrionales bacterium]|nr:hypothetical protein [Bdellovibrionales bacterium]
MNIFNRLDLAIRNLLFREAPNIDRLDKQLVPSIIVITSAAALFAELAIIRLQGSHIAIFALLKNVSLLSCFLGLGIGFAIGGIRPLLFTLFPVLILLELSLLRYLTESYFSLSIANPISEELVMGMTTLEGKARVIVFIFVAAIFFINAFAFAPLGQLISACMRRIPSNQAYNYNLLGSILGVVLFALLSHFWLGGGIWVSTIALLSLPLLYYRWKVFLFGLTCFVIAAGVVDKPFRVSHHSIYSPYQTLDFETDRNGAVTISTNQLYFQRVLNLSDKNLVEHEELKEARAHYDLPFRFISKDRAVLVVGSGAGNDVAAALRAGLKNITAVEIDPVIAKAGRELHPERPYDSENVKLVIADARAFIRSVDQTYDVIVYGLLDSHALLSGSIAGSVRLDSYVYTEEAFSEAKKHLNENGIISLAFVALRPSFGRKIYLMLEKAFDGQPPLVFRTQYDGSITFIAGANKRTIALSKDLNDISEEYANARLNAEISTDDWPFLYMTERKFPYSYMQLWIPLLILSFILMLPLTKIEGAGFSWTAFYLGAAFMLLEAKGFTEMALVCGTTSFVTSSVILGVLVAAWGANYFVQRGKALTVTLAFCALLASLCLSYLGTFIPIQALPLTFAVVCKVLLLTLPIFFAGMCFSNELRTGKGVGSVFFANLLGALSGGIFEYTSMYFGFSFLYFAASVLYVLAFYCAKRAI